MADLLAFMLLFKPIGVPAALVISRVLAGIVGFCCHKWFSFQSSGTATLREIAGYIGLAGVNYLISLSLIMSVPWSTDAEVALTKLAVEILIFVANYLFLRKLFLPS